MSIQGVLFWVVMIGMSLVFATWLLGHVWVFIIIVLTALGGIAWSGYQKNKESKKDP